MGIETMLIFKYPFQTVLIVASCLIRPKKMNRTDFFDMLLSRDNSSGSSSGG
jgi:hypothetical protein